MFKTEVLNISVVRVKKKSNVWWFVKCGYVGESRLLRERITRRLLLGASRRGERGDGRWARKTAIGRSERGSGKRCAVGRDPLFRSVSRRASLSSLADAFAAIMSPPKKQKGVRAKNMDKLIAAVQARECLWDKNYRGHRNRFKLERYWNEVAAEVGTTSKYVYSVSPSDCEG